MLCNDFRNFELEYELKSKTNAQRAFEQTTNSQKTLQNMVLTTRIAYSALMVKRYAQMLLLYTKCLNLRDFAAKLHWYTLIIETVPFRLLSTLCAECLDLKLKAVEVMNAEAFEPRFEQV